MSDAARARFVGLYAHLLLREVAAWATDPAGDRDVGRRVVTSAAFAELERAFGEQRVNGWLRTLTIDEVPAELRAAIGEWLLLGLTPSLN